MLILGSARGQQAATKDADAPKAEAKNAPKADASLEFPDSPEGAFKTLFLAMMTQDEKGLRQAILPLPAEDLKMLLSGEPIPPEFKAQFRDKILPTLKIRQLKSGERIKIPGGRFFEIKPEEVTADRAVILEEANSIPFRCRKIDGHWKVDASPLIAARKAADAARKRTATKKQK